MLAGTTRPQARLAQRHVRANAARGPARLAGDEAGFTAPAAAFANAVAAHALDFDDNCYAGFVHGSAVIVPAAVAQARHATGEQLLVALVVGAECQYRIGRALGRELYDRGWWTTGLLGRIGAAAAAAAAARLLALSGTAFDCALGLAIAGAGGAKSAFGCDAKPLLAGEAAEAGVRAAMLAALGASAPLDALEGDYGLAALCNGGHWDGAPLAPEANQWCLLDPGVDIKRIPVCLSSHAAVDAVMQLAARHGITPARVQRVECDVPPIVVANLRYQHPVTSQQAQFSLPFAVAAALCFGDIQLQHLHDDILTGSQMQRLMDRVSMISTPRWEDAALLQRAPEGAVVTLTLDDGTQWRQEVEQAYGTAAHPLDSAALNNKFRHCVSPVLGREAADHLLQQLWALPALSVLEELLGTPTGDNHGV